MPRQKLLTDKEVQWANLQRVRGCKMDDIAAVLEVDRRTLQREFQERGYIKPQPLPDEDWIKSHFATK